MGDHPLTPAEELVWEDAWAFSAQGTSSGGDTGFVLTTSTLPQISSVGRDIIVDGICYGYYGAVKPVLVLLSSSFPNTTTYIEHPLEDFTTTINVCARSYRNLAMPIRLTTTTNLARIYVVGGTDFLDVASISAWGRFREEKGRPPEPMPVVIKSERPAKVVKKEAI